MKMMMIMCMYVCICIYIYIYIYMYCIWNYIILSYMYTYMYIPYIPYIEDHEPIYRWWANLQMMSRFDDDDESKLEELSPPRHPQWREGPNFWKSKQFMKFQWWRWWWWSTSWSWWPDLLVRFADLAIRFVDLVIRFTDLADRLHTLRSGGLPARAPPGPRAAPLKRICM